MAKTNVPCPHCGKPLVETRGFGDGNTPQLVCGNIGCPSMNRHNSCPECDSNDKEIHVRGLGDKVFICNDCGHSWSTLK